MIITVVIKAIIIVSIIKGKYFLRSNVSYIVIMAANYAKTSALIAWKVVKLKWNKPEFSSGFNSAALILEIETTNLK